MLIGVKSLALCALYMIVGPVLVLVNKDILASGFPYPILLSSLGLVFASLTAHLLAAFGVVNIGKRDQVTWSFWFHNVLPVGACHAATLAFGNAQYLYMGVAMIQFLKAYTPIVVTGVAAVLLGERPSFRVCLALLALCGGTSVSASSGSGAGGEGASFGLFLAAGSASTEAVRLVCTQFVLQNCKFTLWESQYFLAPGAAMCLVGTGLWHEGAALWASGDLGRVVSEKPLSLAGAASLGLGVQLLTSAVIQGPGAVTLKVLSQVRNAGLVLVGMAVYHETVTPLQGCGYVLSLAAFGVYNVFALQDKARKEAKLAKEGDDQGGDDDDVDNGVHEVGNRSDANTNKRSLVRGEDSNQKMQRGFNRDPMVQNRAGNSERSSVSTSGGRGGRGGEGGGGGGVLGGGGRSSNRQKAKTSPLAAESPVQGGGGDAVGKGLDLTHSTGGSLHVRTGASCRSSGPLREE